MLVVDDDEATLELLKLVLEDDGLVAVSASDGERALDLAGETLPALAILDVCLPGVSGYEVCRRLREARPALPIIFVSGERTDALDRSAGLLLGADDYVLKPFLPEELLARVRAVLRRAAPQDGPLTPRETQVLALLAAGRSEREIAAQLVIAPKTCAKHLERILEKLGAHSRAEAVALAYREELVPHLR